MSKDRKANDLLSAEANKILSRLQKDPTKERLIAKRLSNMWTFKLGKEDKAIFLEKCAGDVFETDIPISCLVAEFWTFFCLGKGLEYWLPKLKRISATTGENKTELNKLLNELISEFEKSITDATRNDSRTFAYLYRRVQTLAKDVCPDNIYGNGQWFGPKGLSKEEEKNCCQNVLQYTDPRLAIQLPSDKPNLSEFNDSNGKFRSGPILRLLRYYRDEAEKKEMGKAVQIRSFCYWLNTHYSLATGLSSFDSLEATKDDEKTIPEIPDSQASPSEVATARDIAIKIFDILDDQESMLYGLWFSQCTLQEIADYFAWSSPQKADAKIKALTGKISDFCKTFTSKGDKSGKDWSLAYKMLALLCTEKTSPDDLKEPRPRILKGGGCAHR